MEIRAIQQSKFGLLAKAGRRHSAEFCAIKLKIYDKLKHG